MWILQEGKIYYVMLDSTPWNTRFTIALFLKINNRFEVATKSIIEHFLLEGKYGVPIQSVVHNVATINGMNLKQFKMALNQAAKNIGLDEVIDIDGASCDLLNREST